MLSCLFDLSSSIERGQPSHKKAEQSVSSSLFMSPSFHSHVQHKKAQNFWIPLILTSPLTLLSQHWRLRSDGYLYPILQFICNIANKRHPDILHYFLLNRLHEIGNCCCSEIEHILSEFFTQPDFLCADNFIGRVVFAASTTALTTCAVSPAAIMAGGNCWLLLSFE